MTEQEITLAQQQLDATVATPGWSRIIVPAINKRIQALESRILDADHPLEPEDYRACLRERNDLAKLRDLPAELMRSLNTNRAALGKRRDGVFSM